LKSELEALGLIVLLIITTFALGVEFGGSGLAGAMGGFGPAGGGGTKSAVALPPKFVLRAEGINPSDLYASGFYKVVPSEMMVPLAGLHAMLVSTGRGAAARLGRTPAIMLTTNASGLASGVFPQGQYEFDVSGSDFAVSTIITMTDNTTSTVNFTLSPSARAVTALKVVSQDSDTGLEPTSRLYALLNYTSAPSNGFSELVGFERITGGYSNVGIVVYLNQTLYGGPEVSFNATLLGSYKGTQGYWATLLPSKAYAIYPSVSVMLFQYTPILEVNYTAG
jgi:hypothetical protein